MTISEANDVQSLTRWILGIGDQDADGRPRADVGRDARDALARLAERSQAKLCAGRDAAFVRRTWPTVGTGLPNGCQAPALGGER